MSANDIHVLPMHDLREHKMSADCECKPTVEVVGAVLLYTHHSYDHREFFEELEAWFNSEEAEQ